MEDEIICPECGHPNLAEAEKCWYCQIPLVAKNDNPPDADPGNALEDLPIETSTKSLPDQTYEEDIPAWLKRIRELKKADQPEEEVDRWQQEKLFAGQAEDQRKPEGKKENSHGASKQQEESIVKAPVSVDQPTLKDTTSETDEIKEIQEPEKDSDKDKSEEDLPDGFTPFKED